MKMKHILQKAGAGIAILSLLAMNANAVDINKKFVDSNQWTKLLATTKNGQSAPTVKVTKIYKADGKDSNYKRVRFRIQYGTKVISEASSTTAILDSPTDIPIRKEYNSKGQAIALYAMGNDPKLDCYITGVFSPN